MIIIINIATVIIIIIIMVITTLIMIHHLFHGIFSTDAWVVGKIIEKMMLRAQEGVYGSDNELGDDV